MDDVRWVGLGVASILLVSAGLHAYWAAGGTWPAATEVELAETVVGGPGTKMPAAPLTAAVAALLVLAAVVVLASAGTWAVAPPRILVWATWALSGTLLLRGIGGIVADLLGGLEHRFARLDIVLYSPLCVALGLGCLVVARAAKPAP